MFTDTGKSSSGLNT